MKECQNNLFKIQKKKKNLLHKLHFTGMTKSMKRVKAKKKKKWYNNNFSLLRHLQIVIHNVLTGKLFVTVLTKRWWLEQP